jgi:YgiT-type zinc finger domain-containing protein
LEEVPDMKCVVCRYGETRPGTTTLVLQRGGAMVVINDVRARVCETCGEDYVDEQVVDRALTPADAAARTGVALQIRDYEPA